MQNDERPAATTTHGADSAPTPSPAADAHALPPPSGFWREGYRRLARNHLAVISLFVVAAMVVLGYSAPLISAYFTRFSLDEQHSLLVYSPPGSFDVSLDHPTYDGEKSWFDIIDTDGDGYLSCSLRPALAFSIPSLQVLANLELPASLQTADRTSVYDYYVERAVEQTAALTVPLQDIMRYQLGDLDCPELDRNHSAWRFYDFLFADYDVALADAAPDPRGLRRQPDRRISRLEFPDDDALPSRYRGLVVAGDEGFARLDLDGDGYIVRDELLAATRYLRFDKDRLLAAHDGDRDLRISRAEFPGVPALHTFFLGTDGKGRDLLTRMLYGARISITIGVLATLVSFFIGVTWGSIAGYFGGRVDAVMMRIVDVLYGLPFMFVVILLIVFTGRSTINLFIALGAVQWLTMSRLVRGQVLSLRRREFVEAAEAIGVRRIVIVFRHLLRNTVGPVIVYATLMVPAVIKEEAFLSFLGLGVQPPNPSWGNLISEGATKLEDFYWLILFPGLTLAITLFCMNFLGDGIRDALDPQMKRR